MEVKTEKRQSRVAKHCVAPIVGFHILYGGHMVENNNDVLTVRNFADSSVRHVEGAIVARISVQINVSELPTVKTGTEWCTEEFGVEAFE